MTNDSCVRDVLTPFWKKTRVGTRDELATQKFDSPPPHRWIRLLLFHCRSNSATSNPDTKKFKSPPPPNNEFSDKNTWRDLVTGDVAVSIRKKDYQLISCLCETVVCKWSRTNRAVEQLASTNIATQQNLMLTLCVLPDAHPKLNPALCKSPRKKMAPLSDFFGFSRENLNVLCSTSHTHTHTR